jgi:hypothetical protein
MNVTPNNAWPGSFPVIDDGDVCGNAEHLATAQSLADAVTYLKTRVVGARPSYEYILPLVNLGLSADWVFTGGRWLSNGVGADQPFWLPIGPLPRNQGDAPLYLKEVMVVLAGATGHGGQPGTMPKLRIWKLQDGSTTQIGSTTTDAWTDAATYEAPHSLFVPLSHAIELFPASGGALFAKIDCESGANSMVGLQLLGAKAVVSETP